MIILIVKLFKFILIMMKKLIKKDKKIRKIFKQHEFKRKIFKFLNSNRCLDNFKLRSNIILEFSKLPKKSSKSFIKNRCILTGRSRSVFRFFKISRIKLRELGNVGDLPGIKKAS